jgi:ribosomal protein S12 methylthiotransferase RimO
VSVRVSLVTLGCARNEVDSEELAGRLAAAGFELVEEAADADAVVVNTCGFVEAAKKDSIDTLLSAADLKGVNGPKAVVAVGCLAERYGGELANALPEADAVLGFDDYPDIAERLNAVLRGDRPAPPTPRDRRLLLPLAPSDRAAARSSVESLDTPDIEGVAAGPHVMRKRLGSGPTASLKLASGCDRRCSFCAIPSFRGAFVSRTADEIMNEARWLASQGVRELVLVSENSTSYGKDLGDLRALEALLPQFQQIEGLARVRVSYLQPAETRPGLVQSIALVPGISRYFDLSFQHSAPEVLRRMRRFGGTDTFLTLLADVREHAPTAGVRSNVIVGFPGETEADLDELERFLVNARLDAIGVFGFSAEDGTEAADLDGQHSDEVIAARVTRFADLVDELMSQRAEERIGETVEVLVEVVTAEGVEGRSDHQGPEVDGITYLVNLPGEVAVGDIVSATVVGSEGADLIATPVSA